MSFENMMSLRRGLMELIIPLEREHGLWYPDTFPADLGTRQGQMLAKEHHSRFAEEILGEVLTAKTLTDRVEELTDAFLFYLSLCVVTGVMPDKRYWTDNAPTMTTVELAAMTTSCSYSAMNMLKARPWRRVFSEPDRKVFDSHLQLAGMYLWRMFGASGVSSMNELEQLYLEKHENAVRRLTSGY